MSFPVFTFTLQPRNHLHLYCRIRRNFCNFDNYRSSYLFQNFTYKSRAFIESFDQFLDVFLVTLDSLNYN